MSNLVTPSEYGSYGLFLTATPLGVWVVHSGLIKFVSRHWGASENRGGLLQGLVRAYLRKIPWLLLIAAPVAWLLDRSHAVAVWLLLGSAASALALQGLTQATLQAARENWRDLGASTVASTTRTFVPPLLYTLLGGSVFALYEGFALHALITACFGVFLLRGHWTNDHRNEAPVSRIYDGPLFMVLAVAGWLMSSVNRWIAAAFFGSATTGYFTLAGNVAMIAASVLAAVFTQYFQPGFFLAPQDTAADRASLARHVDRVAAAYWASSLLGVALLQFAAPWFVGTWISERFRPAVAYIIPAGFFLTALLTGAFYHALLLAGKKERACGPLDLSLAAVLAGGSLLAAAVGGEKWFRAWLCLSPLATWTLSRPIASHFFFKSDEDRAPAAAR